MSAGPATASLNAARMIHLPAPWGVWISHSHRSSIHIMNSSIKVYSRRQPALNRCESTQPPHSSVQLQRTRYAAEFGDVTVGIRCKVIPTNRHTKKIKQQTLHLQRHLICTSWPRAPGLTGGNVAARVTLLLSWTMELVSVQRQV